MGRSLTPKADGMIAASCGKAPQRFVAVHLKYDGTPITIEVMLTPPPEFLKRARLWVKKTRFGGNSPGNFYNQQRIATF